MYDGENVFFIGGIVTNKEEYNSLRTEIIELVNIQNNYIIAMYTITIAILSLAIQQENEWLFLLPYIILFSFQRIISAKNDGMLRIAAYIAVFLDENIGWEKNYNQIIKATRIANHDKFSKFMNVISGRISSMQLGVVCSLGCAIMCIKNIGFSINEWSNLNFWEMLPMVIGLFLFGGLREWCKGALQNIGVRDEYIKNLEILKTEIEKKQD